MYDKNLFLDKLSENMSLVAPTCKALGMSRSTYQAWLRTDEAFRAAVEEIREQRLDYIENKLLQRIEAGDTSAITFALKTIGRRRGWSDRHKSDEEKEQERRSEEREQAQRVNVVDAEKRRKQQILRLMRKSGRYTPDLSLQVELTAGVWARLDVLRDMMAVRSYKPVLVQKSREGDWRETPNPLERECRELTQQVQAGLRALGLNVDAKPRKDMETDTLGEFLDALKE